MWSKVRRLFRKRPVVTLSDRLFATVIISKSHHLEWDARYKKKD